MNAERPRGIRCLLFATAVVILAFARPAAAAFAYKTCSTNANAPDYVAMRSGPFEFERATSNGNNYANWANMLQWVRFNPNVAVFSPRMANFVTEAGYDYLRISSFYNQTTLSGVYADGYTGGTYFMSGGAFSWTWFTDFMVNMASRPHISQAAVACVNGQPLTSTLMSMNTRYEGVLLGTTDVQYWQVDIGDAARATISVDVLASNVGNVDLDVYVSTASSNPFPDNGAGHWNYKATSNNPTGTINGGGEVLQIPYSASPRTLYIGVYSFNGSGHYALHASQWKPEATVKSTYTVCAEGGVSSSSPQWANYRSMLKNLSARVVQFTNGGIWPLKYVHRTITGCNDSYCTNYVAGDCDFVMTVGKPGSCSNGQAQTPGRIRLANLGCAGAYANPAGVAFVEGHEWGHGQFGMVHEYQSIGNWDDGDRGPYCGHSIMNFPDQSHVLCTGFNHCQDPAINHSGQPYVGGNCSSGSDKWSQLIATGKVYSWIGPAPLKSPNQWDSLRENQNFLNSVVVSAGPN